MLAARMYGVNDIRIENVCAYKRDKTVVFKEEK